jgi:hypothetical protein
LPPPTMFSDSYANFWELEFFQLLRVWEEKFAWYFCGFIDGSHVSGNRGLIRVYKMKRGTGEVEFRTEEQVIADWVSKSRRVIWSSVNSRVQFQLE